MSRVAGYSSRHQWGDWSLCRWDAATGALRAAVRCRPPGEVHFTAFSADGRRVVTVLHEGTWYLWDGQPGPALPRREPLEDTDVRHEPREHFAES